MIQIMVKPSWRNGRRAWFRSKFFHRSGGSTPPDGTKYSVKTCGYGITAVHQPSKLVIGVRPPLPAPLDFGGIPERPKGADCKSASDAFDGSNPSPATIFVNQHQFKLVFFLCLQILFF